MLLPGNRAAALVILCADTPNWQCGLSQLAVAVSPSCTQDSAGGASCMTALQRRGCAKRVTVSVHLMCSVAELEVAAAGSHTTAWHGQSKASLMRAAATTAFSSRVGGVEQHQFGV
jgi:hypothetical protein